MGALGLREIALLNVIFVILLSCQCPTFEASPLADLTVPFIRVVDRFYEELGNLELGSECQEHSRLLWEASKGGQDWAIQAVDASGHADSGLLNGGLTYPGLYSQCVGVVVNTSTTEFNGQHCLGDITFSGNDDDSPKDIAKSLWKVLVNNTLKLGLCFPSSCTTNQAKIALNSSLNSIFEDRNFDLLVHSCNSKTEKLPIEIGAIVVAVVLTFLLAMSVIGTLYDISKEFSTSNTFGCFGISPWSKNNQRSSSDIEVNNLSTETLCRSSENTAGAKWSQILLSFSVRRNGAKILQVGKEHGSIDIFHGMRFLSMLWIIMGHSCSFAFSWLTFKNPRQLDQTGNNILSQTLENGTFSVDTFFYLSGFLIVFVSMKNLRRMNSKLNLLVAVVHRYIRMTPLMMIVIAFTANLLQYVGSGPFWLSSIQMYDSWCRDNWWTNLFYLQNFIKTPNMCLSHTWYSAVDFQFFIVAVLVLYILNKNIKAGLTTIGLLLATTITITAYLIAANNYPGVPYIGNVVPQSLSDAFSSNVYIKPYCRMGPYLIGMALGYYLSLKKDGIVWRKKYVAIAWIVAVLVNLVILYSTYPAYLGILPSTGEAATYGSVSRTIWAIGLSWLTVACISGYGGFVNTILSWRAFVPLSRLTYCAYLIHPVVMAVFYGSRQISFDFSPFLLLYFVLGNLVITYVSAFILSVLFESPFISLEKIFMKHG